MLKFLRQNLCLLVLLCVLPVTASANIFDDAGDWASDRYDDARDAAEDVEKAAEEAAKEIQDSAKYINDQVVHQAEELSKQAADSIVQAANYMGDLVKDLTDLNKSCQDTLSGFESKGEGFVKGMPHLPESLNNMPGTPEALFSYNCRKYQVNGFTCGIFPYLDDIATAIAAGSADVKKLSQYVNHAYGSSACNHINVAEKPMCALVVGIAKMSEESMSCMANVVADIAHNGKGGGGVSLPSDFEKTICTQMGEITFASAADKLALGLASEEDLQRLIKFAKNLQRALRAQDSIAHSDRVEDVCKHGAKAGKKNVYTAPDIEDTYADIISDNPGKHLLLLKDLSSNMCLDGYGMHVSHDRPVQIYGCHGHSNQRWSFHKVDSVAGNYFYVVNDRYNTCVEDTSAGLVLKKCNVSNQHQLFTPRHVSKETVVEHSDGTTETVVMSKKTGMLQNLATKNCMGLNTTELKDEIQLKGYDCDDKSFNGIWYVNDPAKQLLEPAAGAHLNVYSNPSAPTCLSMAPFEVYADSKADIKSPLGGINMPGNFPVKAQGNSLGVAVWAHACEGKDSQLWSVHTVETKNGTFDQYWNDKRGKGSCLTDNGEGKRYSVTPCDENNEKQLFTVSDKGQLQNAKTGLCLAIRTGENLGLTQNTFAASCSDADGQVWYKIKKH